MTDNSLLSQMHAFDLFSELTEQDMVISDDQFTHRFYNEGDHIIELDGEGTDVFFLLSGAVSVVTYTVTGKELELKRFEAPGYFGELTAIDDTPRSAEVIALKKCECISMIGADFRDFLIKNPSALMKLAQKLAEQVRQSNFQAILNAPL